MNLTCGDCFTGFESEVRETQPRCPDCRKAFFELQRKMADEAVQHVRAERTRLGKL